MSYNGYGFQSSGCFRLASLAFYRFLGFVWVRWWFCRGVCCLVFSSKCSIKNQILGVCRTWWGRSWRLLEPSSVGWGISRFHYPLRSWRKRCQSFFLGIRCRIPVWVAVQWSFHTTRIEFELLPFPRHQSVLGALQKVKEGVERDIIFKLTLFLY